jgi:hypothetical protein
MSGGRSTPYPALAGLFLVIFLPVLADLSLLSEQNTGPFFFLSIVAMFTLALAQPADPGAMGKSTPVAGFTVFCWVLLGLFAAKLVFVDSTMKNFFYLTHPLVFAIGMGLYLRRRSAEALRSLGVPMVTILAGIFIVQLVLSAYESWRGDYITANVADLYDIYNVDVGFLEERILLSMVTSSSSILSALKIPFSGMLGQHNYWGTQLPFYNLLFWYALLRTRGRAWWGLLFAILVACLFNSSRFGITSVVLTDAVVLYACYPRLRKALLVAGIIMAAAALWSLAGLLSVWGEYFEKADTLTGRLTSYDQYIAYFFTQSPLVMVFGAGLSIFSELSLQITGEWNSFESELFYRLFLNGIAGLALVIGLIAWIWRQGKLPGNPYGLLLTLTAVNIIVVSLVSNLAFTRMIIPFIILVLALAGAHAGTDSRTGSSIDAVETGAGGVAS